MGLARGPTILPNNVLFSLCFPIATPIGTCRWASIWLTFILPHCGCVCAVSLLTRLIISCLTEGSKIFFNSIKKFWLGKIRKHFQSKAPHHSPQDLFVASKPG